MIKKRPFSPSTWNITNKKGAKPPRLRSPAIFLPSFPNTRRKHVWIKKVIPIIINYFQLLEITAGIPPKTGSAIVNSTQSIR